TCYGSAWGAAAVGSAAPAVRFVLGAGAGHGQIFEQNKEMSVAKSVRECIRERRDIGIRRPEILQDGSAPFEQHFDVENLQRQGEVPSQACTGTEDLSAAFGEHRGDSLI